MSLTAREQQALHAIEDEIAGSDPKLASLLATFTRLTSGEEMPVREKIPASRDPCAGAESSSTPANYASVWAGSGACCCALPWLCRGGRGRAARRPRQARMHARNRGHWSAPDKRLRISGSRHAP